MSTGRKVREKSAFPSSFDLSTVLKAILCASLQNDRNLTSSFLCHMI